MEYLQLRWRKSSNENKSKLINNAVQLWWEFLDWNVRLMGFKQWNPYKGIRLRYSTSYLQSSAMAFQSRFKTLILHNISRTVIVLFFLLKHLNIFYLNFGSNSSSHIERIFTSKFTAHDTIDTRIIPVDLLSHLLIVSHSMAEFGCITLCFSIP